MELRSSQEAEADAGEELWVDDERVPFGSLPDGSYYATEYAYDWRDDPLELARALIDYRSARQTILDERQRHRTD